MYKYLFLLTMMIISTTLKADYGCVPTGYAGVFLTYTGITMSGYKVYEKTSSYDEPDVCNYYITSTNCQVRTTVSAECYALDNCYYPGSGSYYYARGKEYYFQPPSVCPIDDYVPYLIIILGTISVFFIKNKSLIA